MEFPRKKLHVKRDVTSYVTGASTALRHSQGRADALSAQLLPNTDRSIITVRRDRHQCINNWSLFFKTSCFIIPVPYGYAISHLIARIEFFRLLTTVALTIIIDL